VDASGAAALVSGDAVLKRAADGSRLRRGFSALGRRP